jgi:hypothetical protein
VLSASNQLGSAASGPRLQLSCRSPCSVDAPARVIGSRIQWFPMAGRKETVPPKWQTEHKTDLPAHDGQSETLLSLQARAAAG